MSFQIRANDRLSDSIINNNILLNEGYGPNRGTRNTKDPVYGLRSATASTPGAVAFTSPVTGQIGYAAPLRPGVDQSGFPWRFNPAYQYTGPDVLGTYNVNVNHDSDCEDFPYGPPGCASNHVMFEQEGILSCSNRRKFSSVGAGENSRTGENFSCSNRREFSPVRTREN